MTKTCRFIFNGDNTIHDLALFVIGLEYHKVKPTTKHHSHGRKINRTWPKKIIGRREIQNYLIMQQQKPNRLN